MSLEWRDRIVLASSSSLLTAGEDTSEAWSMLIGPLLVVVVAVSMLDRPPNCQIKLVSTKAMLNEEIQGLVPVSICFCDADKYGLRRVLVCDGDVQCKVKKVYKMQNAQKSNQAAPPIPAPHILESGTSTLCHIYVCMRDKKWICHIG